MNLVDLLLILPAAGFLLTLAAPVQNARAARIMALAFSLVTLVLSLGMAAPVWSAGADRYFVTDIQWVATPSIRYHVAVDGLSLWLVILTALLTPICVLISWNAIQDRVKEFHAFLLLLECGLIGVFVAQDLFLFYVFWEVSLVPMYFLIGIWGHGRRIYAAVKFFLFTMAGSVLMLAAIIYLYNQAGTFDYRVLMEYMNSGRLVLSRSQQLVLFLAFFIAFAIKVPLFPPGPRSSGGSPRFSSRKTYS